MCNCGNNNNGGCGLGNISSCTWIIILIALWYFCCNNGSGCGNGCGNGCGCNPTPFCKD